MKQLFYSKWALFIEVPLYIYSPQNLMWKILIMQYGACYIAFHLMAHLLKEQSFAICSVQDIGAHE